MAAGSFFHPEVLYLALWTALAAILQRLDDWKAEYGLKNGYLRDVDDYIGIHGYFKNTSNFGYPWELQIWDEQDAAANIRSHPLYKRGFVCWFQAA